MAPAEKHEQLYASSTNSDFRNLPKDRMCVDDGVKWRWRCDGLRVLLTERCTDVRVRAHDPLAGSVPRQSAHKPFPNTPLARHKTQIYSAATRECMGTLLHSYTWGEPNVPRGDHPRQILLSEVLAFTNIWYVQLYMWQWLRYAEQKSPAGPIKNKGGNNQFPPLWYASLLTTQMHR